MKRFSNDKNYCDSCGNELVQCGRSKACRSCDEDSNEGTYDSYTGAPLEKWSDNGDPIQDLKNFYERNKY